MKTPANIIELKEKLKAVNLEKQKETLPLEEKIQTAWNKYFDEDKELQESIKVLENCDTGFCNYKLEYDNLYLTTGLDCFSDYNNADCLEYLSEYLESNYNIYLDTEMEAINIWLGDDFIAIQEDTRHNNGVWQYGQLIISEDEYKEYTDDDRYRVVNEELRNRLIEEHMERDGCFSNVGVVTSYGDFYPVNTSKK